MFAFDLWSSTRWRLRVKKWKERKRKKKKTFRIVYRMQVKERKGIGMDAKQKKGGLCVVVRISMDQWRQAAKK